MLIRIKCNMTGEENNREKVEKMIIMCVHSKRNDLFINKK